MKTKFKKSNKIISLMLALVMVVSLLPMNILMATAAPAETSELPTSYNGWKPTFATYTEGLTQYFKYGGYLYKAVWKNCNATSVVLSKNSSNALQYMKNGSTWKIILCKGSTGNSNKITVYQLPKTVNGVLVAYGSSSTDVKNTSSHILEITCVGVKAPTWTWSDDKTSATAVFVSEDGKAQVTIGATVTSGTEAAENCQEKDKIIYTASATFNGTAYSDAKTEDGAAGNNHIGGEATCSAKAVCEACGKEYGSPDPDNHDWSNLDGVCASGCGEICEHSYGEGVLTRPVRVTATEWDDGYYTYTCSLCGHYYRETVNRADYSALDAVLDDFIDAMYDATLLDSIRAELEEIYFDNIDVMYGDYIEAEQAEVDALVETMTQKLAEIEQGKEDGSALKPDYTEGDALINGIIEQFYDKGITYIDEIIAEFDVLYNEYMALWHKPETTKPQVDEIVVKLKALKEKIDKGTEDGTLVKVDGVKYFNELASDFESEMLGKYGEECFDIQFTDEAQARWNEIGEYAEGLEGTVAENTEALAKIKAELEAIFDEIEKCLAGTHSFADYKETTPAACGANAKETGICAVCGEADEREIEGTALTHSFTKYEEVTAPECGKVGLEVAYCDNNCGETDEKEIEALEHIFLDYVSNGDATCTADGTKTAFCVYNCGATDTVTDEDTKLSHADEDGDKICDDCRADIVDVCPDCGGKVHEGPYGQYICILVTLIKLVISLLKALGAIA